jgi:hypothetical protein
MADLSPDCHDLVCGISAADAPTHVFFSLYTGSDYLGSAPESYCGRCQARQCALAESVRELLVAGFPVFGLPPNKAEVRPHSAWATRVDQMVVGIGAGRVW